ncbi:MAG: photoactive yellow protein [Variovorax sp.]|nr:photoactive yellow protein [Variovorax sp.]
MIEFQDIAFDSARVLDAIDGAADADLDTLEFGIIGFDGASVVRRYNAFESRMAGLSVQRVIGQPLFTIVAPCMNNYMVAQRFEDATESATKLDDTIDYVLTLRMRPVKVKLRLLADPAVRMRYLLVQRPA